MRFFTPQWHQNLSEESDPVAVTYAEYVRDFWLFLPDAGRMLAEFSLHDGIVSKVALKNTGLVVTLFPYDIQDDPYMLQLTYSGSGLLEQPYRQFLGFKRLEAQILAHELDQTTEGFVHRMLFWSEDEDYDEVEIPFKRLQIELPWSD